MRRLRTINKFRGKSAGEASAKICVFVVPLRNFLRKDHLEIRRAGAESPAVFKIMGGRNLARVAIPARAVLRAHIRITEFCGV